MKGATAIYARWERGAVYVTGGVSDGSGVQREMYLELGGVRSADEARTICRSVLANQALQEQVTAISGDALYADALPGAGYWLGDRIGGEMVTAIHAVLTDDGATITPGLAGRVTLRLDAEQRKLQRAAAGVQNDWATPQYTRPQTGEKVDTTPPEISFDGRLKVRYSPIWRAPKNWWCTWMDLTVVEAGWADTIIKVGKVFSTGPVVPVQTLVLGAGKKRAIRAVNEPWQAGEQLIVWCAVAGGAKQATLSLRGAMI